MTAKVASQSQLQVRLTCEVPAGRSPEDFMDELRALGNPVVRYLPDENKVLLAEFSKRQKSKLNRMFTHLKRLG